MRRAIWMALAFMGTAPLVALAQQQNTGNTPAASPSGAASIERGQDTTATQAPGSPGQQSAGSIGTGQGQPATGGNAGTGTVGSGTGGGGTGSVSGGGAGTGSTGVSGGGAATGRGGGEPSAMQRELTTLRQRVSRLEAEVDALRGTGGGGTGGGGTSGPTPGVDTGTPGPDPEDMKIEGPVTVATAVFDGRVVDVTSKHIDIVDTSDGTFYRLAVDDQTRAFVGPELKRIPVDQISEGTPVRTSFALISGGEYARNIVTQPRRAQQQRGPQGQPQRQQRQGQPQRQQQQQQQR